MIPLAILASELLGRLGDRDLADRVIHRYSLTGSGAEAVRQLFSPVTGAGASLGVVGAVFLVLSVLSFTRAAQRLFEQTWELKPLSVRNTPNGLWWVLSLAAYVLLTGWLRGLLDRGRLDLVATVCTLPLTAVFMVWSGRLLGAKRIGWRDLVPFGVLAAVLTGVYSVGAVVYLPRLFSIYASRYGSVGAVFAMISALFAIMLVLVGSAAVGREVADELRRIRQGRRPPDDEVRRQWDDLVGQMRSRWRSARDRRNQTDREQS
jgi:membrane protein